MAERRQVSIFVNGREVANNLKAITAEKTKVNRELNLMTRGTAEYEAKVKELRGLNGIINEHRQNIGQIESTWQKLGKGVRTFGALAGVGLGADLLVGYGKELFRTGVQMDQLVRKAQTVFALS